MLCGWCYIISVTLVVGSMGYKEWVEPFFSSAKELNAIEKLDK